MPKLQAKLSMPSYKEAINRMFINSPELIKEITNRYKTDKVFYGDFTKLQQKRYQGSSVILPTQPPERPNSDIKKLINELNLND